MLVGHRARLHGGVRHLARAAADPVITVLIADDERLMREALAATIAAEPILRLAGVGASAEEAIRLAAEARPDVALVDVNMPGGGEHAVRGIHEVSPETRVVALSGSEERTVVLGMLQAGAAGYVVKGADPAGVVEVVLRAARGEGVLSAEVAAGVIAELRRGGEGGAARARIRRAIDERLIQPLFQPIVALESGQPVAFEALSRFPEGAAERWFLEADVVGLRAELELAAAHAAAELYAADGRQLSLAVNLGPPALPRIEGPAELGVPGLVVEITEHAAIADYEALRPALARLRELGVRLAVDDVGAGFASLRHALQLSLDFVKLDASLTRGIDADSRRHALAAGLIGFAAELGAEIVAEGIETEAELETLRGLGVGLGQGYLLGPPGELAHR